MHNRDKYFLKEHFENCKGYAPAYLAELVVYCMELLHELSKYNIDFRFKGGNSLLLILPKPLRFSIDVDIDSPVSKERLIEIMQDIVVNSKRFTSLEIRQHKTKPWLPMISFKIFFNSFYQKLEYSYVMLDSVIKKTPYTGYYTKLEIPGIYSSPNEVEVSKAEGIMGDKFLTIGPDTLGIPIGKNKEAQRMKHVFDISHLYIEEQFNKKEFIDSINKCMVQENAIQRSNFSIEQVLSDTEDFLLCPAEYETKLDSSYKLNPRLKEIIIGYQEFRKFLINIDYGWIDMKKDFDKVHKLIKIVRSELGV